MMPMTRALRRRRQHGFTLVELMIAILVGLFLTGGLVMMMQSNRRSFNSQNQLSQLQDGERMAMNMITDMVQIAGYFPDPTINTAPSTMAAITAPVAMASAQYMTGAYAAAAPGDSLTIRFATKSGDGILNCAGLSNTSAGIQSYVNTFYIDGNKNLVCDMGVGGGAATTYTLINGVTNLTVMYGIDSTGTLNNVNQYLNATQVTAAAAWNKVISVQVALTFSNPLYNTATGAVNPGQPATLPAFVRTMAVMNQVGL